MKVDKKKLQHVKESAEQEYKKIGSVHCPYFKKRVAFNAKGLEHIKFKGRNKTRSAKDQYIRFRCLSLAVKIIQATHTLQGIQTKNEMIRVKKRRWTHEMKEVTYYEFVALVEGFRVRVIVKKIDGGELFFWSIIPFWRTDILGKRLMHSGNPSED